MKRFISILAVSFLVFGFSFSNIAFAEDVYVGNNGINATGTKRIDCYLITESISITNDACYADVKEVLNDSKLIDILHFSFCWSPREGIWLYKTENKFGRSEWHPVDNNHISSKVFYDYVNPKRKAQLRH